MDDEIDEFTSSDNYGTTREQEEEHRRQQIARDRVVRVLGRIVPTDLVDAVIPDPEPPSPRQRLRIHVPEVKTTLSMGAAAPAGKEREVDAGAPNFAGFGVHTKGHFFADVELAMTMQAHGDISVQSDQSSVSISAAKATLVHAAQETMLTGDNNLTIAGGISHGVSKNYTSDGVSPRPPDWIASVKGTVSQINEFWTNFDSAAAAIELGILAVDTANAVANRTITKGMIFRAATNAYLGAWGGNLMGFANWAGEPAAEAVGAGAGGGTVVFGDGGLVLGTRRSAGLFSYIGTTVGSATTASVLAPWVGITGLESLELRSCVGNAQMVSGREMELIAGGSVEIASRRSGMALLAKSIEIGSKAASGRQTRSHAVRIDGEKIDLTANSISLTSQGEAGVFADGYVELVSMRDTAAVMGRDAVLHGEDNAAVTSDKQAGLRSGSFLVYATPEKVVLGKAPGTLPARPADPEFEQHAPRPGNPKSMPAYLAARKSVADRNRAKQDSFAAAIKGWKKDVAAMKDASVGIIVKDSSIDLVVSGHRLTIDSTSIRHPHLKILK